MLQITCRYQIVMLSTLHKLILMSVRRVHEIRRTTIQLQQQYPRDGVVVRVSASQSVDLGFIPLLEPYEKTLKMVFVASLLGLGIHGMLWRTSRQVPLLCPRHLGNSNSQMTANILSNT